MHAPRQPDWFRNMPINLLPWGAKTFWALFGGTIVLLAMRLVVVSQLKAEVVSRISSDSVLEVHGSNTADRLRQIDHVIDTIRANQQVTTKAVCLDHTRAQQDLLGVVCPAWLYKGAR